MSSPLSIPQGWQEKDNALTKTFSLASFKEAMAFVMEIGVLAEKADHHPDITINYRSVSLTLCTHSKGHIVTKKDHLLAGQINDIPEDRLVQLKGQLFAAS